VRARPLPYLATLAVLGAACSDAPIAPDVRPPRLDVGVLQPCGSTTTTALRIPFVRDVGMVEAWNDATDLHVVVTTTDGWSFREAQAHATLDASTIPVANDGSPNVSDWLQRVRTSGVTSHTFVFSLASLGAAAGDVVAIAVQASAYGPKGGKKGMAWGAGPLINPAHRAMYFTHTVQSCGGPPPPPPGTDIVVVNDINPFDASAMANPNNVLFVQNLVGFTTSGPRGSATEIVWDRGRLARCGPTGNNECNDSNMGTARSTITGAGYTLVDIASSAGTLDDLLASQGANWKMIWLWTPLEAFSAEEVNALKAFAGEGGRVLFIGEWAGYYPPQGIALENQFLLDMGAVMTNTGGAVNCGYTMLPASSLRAHQITQGLTDLTIACSSVLLPGPTDFPLYLDTANTNVLSAVATISLTPISAPAAASWPSPMGAPAGMNTNSSTGQW
jgi:hypothetical protein